MASFFWPTKPDAIITTPWVAYTPTFTGMGTVSPISIFSRRVGDTLQIRGNFTTGTVGASAATMTIGFNGASGGVVIDAAKIPSGTSSAGSFISANVTNAFDFIILAVSANTGTVSFSIDNASFAGLTALNGNQVFDSTSAYSIRTAEVPIVGWE